MPTDKLDVIDIGYANMEMLNELCLKPIQIRQLPAIKIYEYYLKDEKMDISLLKL